MAIDKTLFGYTLEEQGGRLIITVQGAFAEAALRHLRSNIGSGGGLRTISKLSPIVPLGRLLSSAKVRLEGEADEGEDTDALNTKDLLNQSVEQGFSAFQQQLNEFRQALDEFKKGTRPAARKTRGVRKAAKSTAKRARK